MPLNTDYKKNNFDVDLDFGKMGEYHALKIFENDGRVEVKTERDIWKTTGNIAIEIRCYGKPSCLSTTEAKTWVHWLKDGDTYVGGFIFKVSDLKEKIRKLFKENKARVVMGGDNNATELVLLPIRELFFT